MLLSVKRSPFGSESLWGFNGIPLETDGFGSSGELTIYVPTDRNDMKNTPIGC